jgi:anti-anti-sigma factor
MPHTWKPNPSDLANFSQAVALRYRGDFDPDGSGPASPLPAAQALQVWNEPNQEFFLSPAYAADGTTPFSPAHYRLMLNASYNAVKAVNPQMLVVTGGTSPYGDPPGGPYPDPNNRRIRPVQFWQQVLSGQTLFDVFAHQPINNTGGGPPQSAPDPYDATTPDLGRSQSRIRRGPPSRYRVRCTERQDATEVLEIAVSESGGVRLLRLTGELDLAAVDQFERLLTADHTSEAATFVLDMRELTFIDSSGLRALIMADQRVRDQGGRFVVVRGPEPVNEVLEMTGVARRIELVDEPPAG